MHEGLVDSVVNTMIDKQEEAKKAPQEAAAAAKAAAQVVGAVPVMYVKDHCPKCKGAEQRFRIAKVKYETVNCSEHMDIARKLRILQTPTIIDPDGTRYVGDNAAADWLKAHMTAAD